MDQFKYQLRIWKVEKNMKTKRRLQGRQDTTGKPPQATYSWNLELTILSLSLVDLIMSDGICSDLVDPLHIVCPADEFKESSPDVGFQELHCVRSNHSNAPYQVRNENSALVLRENCNNVDHIVASDQTFLHESASPKLHTINPLSKTAVTTHRLYTYFCTSFGL